MATNSTTYPCPRCGQDRIISRKWEEAAESLTSGQPTFHTLMICPDEECQKKLNAELAAKEEKRAALQLAKEQRQTSRMAKPPTPTDAA